MSHTLTVSLYFRLLWYHSILRGSIDQKHAKTNEIWSQNSEIHSAFACSHWPPWLPDLFKPYGACVKRGSGKHMFGLSLFRPSGQSNISTSGEERFKCPLPRESKISQMPDSRDNNDNQIPTPCPAMCFAYFWTARKQVLSTSFGVIFWGRHFTLMKELFPKRLKILHWNLALETYIL